MFLKNLRLKKTVKEDFIKCSVFLGYMNILIWNIPITKTVIKVLDLDRRYGKLLFY